MECAADGFRDVARREGVRFISYRAVMRSRAQAAVFFVTPVAPIAKSEQAELARIVAGRMAKAMRGA